MSNSPVLFYMANYALAISPLNKAPANFSGRPFGRTLQIGHGRTALRLSIAVSARSSMRINQRALDLSDILPISVPMPNHRISIGSAPSKDMLDTPQHRCRTNSPTNEHSPPSEKARHLFYFILVGRVGQVRTVTGCGVFLFGAGM